MPIRRVFSLMSWRLRAAVADLPLVFFGVVVLVALLFRAGAGWMREARDHAAVTATAAP
ncbi:MAG: hypothetical protein JWP97_3844 [Labilithrix sp.]|nr:hypothetical protein [Labilithrix sp.]